MATNQELPEILESLNADKYKDLIQRCRNNEFHCFKSSLVTPKVALVEALKEFPELHYVSLCVQGGVYDEQPDEEDFKELRKMILVP